MTKDPFERAVAKEAAMQARIRKYEDPRKLMNLAMSFWYAMLAAWGVLLGLHWAFLREPRWLALVHTLAFAVYLIPTIGATVFMKLVARARPDFFDPDA